MDLLLLLLTRGCRVNQVNQGIIYWICFRNWRAPLEATRIEGKGYRGGETGNQSLTNAAAEINQLHVVAGFFPVLHNHSLC